MHSAAELIPLVLNHLHDEILAKCVPVKDQNVLELNGRSYVLTRELSAATLSAFYPNASRPGTSISGAALLHEFFEFL